MHAPALRLSIALFVLALPPSSVTACVSDLLDCSLNGRCNCAQRCRCICSPGWRGPDCGVLNLGPTGDSPFPGGTGRIYPAPGANTSSWGGGVVFRDGWYHLYVSEMAGHCGLATWGTNSFIRHAISDTVDGIFTPQETVLPTWGHNAMPWVTPEGDITVWHIGNGTRSHPEHTGCSNGTTPLARSAAARAARATGTRSPQPLGDPPPIAHVPYSANPGGPWKRMPITCVLHGGGGNGPCPIDNPTPVAYANGTTLVAHRARGGFGVLVAPHWSGPYRNVIHGQDLNYTNIRVPDDEYSCEDGFLFRDGRDGLHLLCHCNGEYGYPWDDHGRHAFSENGVDWRWSAGRAFLPTFVHPDGTNTTHVSRQRPQLVFGPNQSGPTHLITGISVASTNRPYLWQSGCGELDAVSKPCDLTCTSMQPVLP